MRNFYWRWAVSTCFGMGYLKEYCPEWDAALNRLIDRHWESVQVGAHTAQLGKVRVWIENAFYAYGTEYGAGAEFRPSVRTMRRLDSLVRHMQDREEDKKRNQYLARVRAL
ncbi:hypothetical protein RL74_06805 [Pseudomonas fluorescens]|uniref:Uncharacterized protein n=1 Tax=Pseudomonas fluorescens TaxID=294 RepID=A0A0D0NM84_PSEFL|nr:hypothetical protein RL74_06805 [Pseudomonas fluorescens]